jgi:hypothetical protein
MTDNQRAADSEFAAKLKAAMDLLAKGLGPDGEPLDFAGAASRARASAQEYRRKIQLGEARTAAKIRGFRFKG